ncbi:MAG: glycosyltransferase [Myxococcales bacterium]|nr:glycosyltransferase [Myxococcales bacterium]
MAGKLRIGIPLIGDQRWLGGVQYVVHLVTALARLPESERPEIALVVTPQTLDAFSLHVEAAELADRILLCGFSGPAPARPKITVVPNLDALFTHLDFLFPTQAEAMPGKPTGLWIPDFQHRHMPQLFAADELAQRDRTFGQISEKADLLVLSSHAARRDWERFYPDARPEVRVVSFRASLEPHMLALDPEPVANAYGLPESFLICCNQFWAHKGHDVLFEALGLVRRLGQRVTLVCTGSTKDYRAADYFERLKRLMVDHGIADSIRVLGILPRAEQLALMRRSIAVVQPSLFEGWSTVVEDARLLGKSIIMSDIDVHQEQAPEHGRYFKAGDVADLARVLADALPSLVPGPNASWEELAQSDANAKVVEYGRQMVELARDMPSITARVSKKAVPAPARVSAVPTESRASTEAPSLPLADVFRELRLHARTLADERATER